MVVVETQTGLARTSDFTMLSADALFCERDDRVLFRGLGFSIREGQVLQIKGSNGSGDGDDENDDGDDLIKVINKSSEYHSSKV